MPKGGFPLLRSYHVRTHVNFTRVNKIEAMYERSRANVKAERGSSFTFTRDLPFNVSIIYARNARSRRHVKVEPRSTYFTRSLS